MIIIGMVRVMEKVKGKGKLKAIPLFSDGCHPKKLFISWSSVQNCKDKYFKSWSVNKKIPLTMVINSKWDLRSIIKFLAQSLSCILHTRWRPVEPTNASPRWVFCSICRYHRCCHPPSPALFPHRVNFFPNFLPGRYW